MRESGAYFSDLRSSWASWAPTWKNFEAGWAILAPTSASHESMVSNLVRDLINILSVWLHCMVLELIRGSLIMV